MRGTGFLSWQDRYIEHIPKHMGKRDIPEGMMYQPARWLGLHSEGFGDVFRELAKQEDYGGRVDWSYIEEKIRRFEKDISYERDKEWIFEGELSPADEGRRKEMLTLWRAFPGAMPPALEVARQLNLRLLERDLTGVILAISDVRAFQKSGALLMRHYGPGPHPGTGTSQDVHGDGGAGLGEFTFDNPASRNKIRFNISMQDALRRGLNKGEVNLLGVEYHQELIRAMQNIESAIGFPIEGLVISNDLMDLAVAVYGEQVLDDPLYRESTFGKLREEAIGWRGGYNKRTVWLDEAINTIIGPRKMSDSIWHESVWHEIGHHYTDADGWAGFSYEFNEMMENSDHELGLYPSAGWLEWAHQNYGNDTDTILGEYRADLFASWVGFNLSDRMYDTPIWRRRFTGLQGPLAPEDVKNMENLMNVVMDEGKKKASLIERQADEKVLVFFPIVGEVLAISISSLDKLPVQAIILDQISSA